MRNEVLFLVNRGEFRPDIIGVIESLPVELKGRLDIILERSDNVLWV